MNVSLEQRVCAFSEKLYSKYLEIFPTKVFPDVSEIFPTLYAAKAQFTTFVQRALEGCHPQRQNSQTFQLR